jgi:hypothetical protein
MGNNSSRNKNDVLINLNSGLGNQYFMIAAAYAYCLKYHKNLKIPTSWKGISKSRPSYWNTLLVNCQPYLIDNLKLVGIKYKEPSFAYKEIPIFNSVSLQGFFQSEKYFEEYETEIRKLFEFSEELKQFAKSFYNSSENEVRVAVHIRRGDYIKKKNKHTLLSLDYYTKAKEYIENRVKDKSIRYVYFSDDIKWVKKNFILNEKDMIIQGYKDYEDFVLMSHCHHFINANSTFSWWAAWLSQTDINKLVVVPSKWFGPKGPSKYQSIYSKYFFKLIKEKSILDKSKFFLSVITCNKYENKRKQHEKQMDKCPFDYKYFIGNPELTEAQIDGNVVYLPCSDAYEKLPEKVYEMLKWVKQNYPDVEYIIKSDDDVKFNFKNLKILSRYIYENNIDYTGVKVKVKEGYGTCHLGKSEDPIINVNKQYIPNTVYCAGPCYFLSMKSVNIILDNLMQNKTIYEDQSIGYCLGKNGIKPYHVNLKSGTCKWN